MPTRIFAFIALLAIPGFIFCQETPTTVAQMKQMLQVSQRRGQLNMEGMTPFHLKASFQELDRDGKPTGKGTIEELWQSPTRYRETLTVPGMKRITGKDGKEEFEETTDGSSRELIEVDNGTTAWRTGEWILLGEISAAVNATLQPFIYKVNVSDRLNYQVPAQNDASLECIGTEPDIPGVSAETRLAFTTYCLNQGNHLLRLLTMPNGRAISFNEIKPFDKKYIARSIAVASGDMVRLKLHIDILEKATDFSSLEIAPPPSAQVLHFHRAQVPYLSGEVMPGQLLLLVQPKIESRKPLVVKVNIDTTGAVTSAEVIKNQNPKLDPQLLDTIKQWKFRVSYQGNKLVPLTLIVNLSHGPESVVR